MQLAAAVVPDAARAQPAVTEGDTAIRPFRVEIPDAALADLRRRLAATRWPDREIVADQSQGVQLAALQRLVRYWETGRSATASFKNPPPHMMLPAAYTVFPDELFPAPRHWVKHAYHHLEYFNEAPKGGHFAAWEEPEIFSQEMRAAFASLRNGSSS